jgi:hypothetical protein
MGEDEREELEEGGRRRCPRKKKESRDSVDGGSYGDGTFTVHGKGSKTCW